jgi:glycosyltransferase involved in cell wall biosynthesis
MKKKICFAMKYLYQQRLGGAEVQAWLLAKQLAKSGHQVTYIAENLNNSSKKIETIEGVEIHWIPNRYYFDILNHSIYYKTLKQISPDIIVHRYTSLYTGIIGKYAKLHNIHFIWICTDDGIPFKNHFRQLQQRILKRTPKNLITKFITQSYASIRDRYKNYGMKYVTHPCVQNQDQYNFLLKNFGLKGFFFHSGHEKPKSIQPANPPLILWVGNLGPRKRPEIFIELAKQCSQLNLHFRMVGTHPDKALLDKLFADKSTNLEWKGALPLEETLAVFDQASILVSTSTYEGFPNTFVQAWLRGIPVISFGINPNQVVTKHNLGKIVNSIPEAQQAIIQLSNDTSTERERIKQYAQQHHSIESVEKRFWEILS